MYANRILTAFVLGLVASTASATIITADLTASIANAANSPATHFHSLPSSNQFTQRDLNGHASNDETRVVSLLDLASESSVASAILHFTVSGFGFGNALQRYDIVSYTDLSGLIEGSDFRAAASQGC